MQARCFGFTRTLKRCKNTRSSFIYCEQHKRQWILILFTIVLPILLGLISIVSKRTDLIKNYENQKALYLQALGYFDTNKLNSAEELFKKLYNASPNYPNCTYFLGKTLFFLYKYDEALAILTLVANIEEHYDTNYMIGKIYYDQGNYPQSNKYLELSMPKLEYDKDSRYWAAYCMNLECLRKIHNMTIDSYAIKVNDFCSIIDFELENSIKHSSNWPSNTDISFRYDVSYKEVDWILSQKIAAFLKLIEISKLCYLKDKNIDAFDYALKAFRYLKSPIRCTGSGLHIKSGDFMEALSFITLILSEIQYQNNALIKIKIDKFRMLLESFEQDDEQMGRISISSKDYRGKNLVRVTLDCGAVDINAYPDVLEFINAIKAIFGFSGNLVTISHNSFYLKYYCTFIPREDIVKLNISCEKYKLNKTIYIKYKEDNIIDQDFKIDAGFTFNEKPIFRVTRFYRSGSPCCYYDILVPWIRYGNLNPLLYDPLLYDHFNSHLKID